MMTFEAGIATVLLTMTGAFVYLRWTRAGLYRSLDSKLLALSPFTGTRDIPSRALPGFSDRLVVLNDVLSPAAFDRLARCIDQLSRTERSYLPSHKKGGTIAYETLVSDAPDIVGFYQSPEMLRLISEIVGQPVEPTPLHDQSSCSVLVYEKPGDHIGWHYDHNFYKGRHFTVLLPIVNRGSQPGTLSAARLMAKLGSEERSIATPPNTMVVFEGARVVHKVTPIKDGERRVVLSMTYCTDPRNSMLQGVARRIKDTAFFGIRALWT